MAYEKLVGRSLEYDPCRYPGSKLLFRGPKRSLTGDYFAFLGGTETYGKFIQMPFVDMIEKALGVECANFGCSNAGVDVFLNDEGIMQLAADARATVLQLPCAQNMSNRFYTVHPRRNDRFVEPLPLMRELFPDVDFSEFHFTRHLLGQLQARAPDRFAIMRRELQTIWIARMRLLLDRLGGQVILLWFSKRRPSQDNDSADVSLSPALVTRPMIEALRDHALAVTELCGQPEKLREGTHGMVCSRVELAAAAELLGPEAHRQAADALVPELRRLMM